MSILSYLQVKGGLLSELAVSHEEELALNQAAFFALCGLVDRQQERIGRLEKTVDDLLTKMILEQGRSLKSCERIKRLEKIILAMSNGLVTTYPEAGTIHTHQIYPCNGVRALVEEIKDNPAPSPDPLLDESSDNANQASKKAGRGRLIGEEPEPNGARWAADPEGNAVDKLLSQSAVDLWENDPVAVLQAELDDPHYG